jgi:hypothetical protein
MFLVYISLSLYVLLCFVSGVLIHRILFQIVIPIFLSVVLFISWNVFYEGKFMNLNAIIVFVVIIILGVWISIGRNKQKKA